MKTAHLKRKPFLWVQVLLLNSLETVPHPDFLQQHLEAAAGLCVREEVKACWKPALIPQRWILILYL